jgi:hypothetical protein
MASAIPGGAPGYDDDKEFGNNITHIAAKASQRLRGTIAAKPQKSREEARFRGQEQCSGVPGAFPAVFPGWFGWSFRDGPKDQTRKVEVA